MTAGDRDPVAVPPLLALPLAERRGMLDLAELNAAAYRTELVEHISRTDPVVGAFAEWRSEDVAASSIPDAVSVTYKDNIHVAGYPTRLGVRGYREDPGTSAAIADRLRGAGLHCIGKVTTTECSIGKAKPARNPRYPHVSTAGSSCGSAVAVAAGFCDVSVGTDSGGSLRWPAVYCGVTALRLTPLPTLIQGIHAVAPSMESAGVMTRTAADLGWLWHSHRLAQTLGLPLVAYQGRLRFAAAAPEGEPLHDEVRALLDAVADALESDGDVRVDVDLRQTWETRTPAAELLAREAHDSYAPVARHPGVVVGSDTLATLERGAAIGEARYADLRLCRESARAALRELLTERIDLLVMPLEAGLPDPVIARPCAEAGAPDLTLVASFAGLPALAIPLARSSEGSPLGIQVLAAPGSDELLVAVARRLEGLADRIDRATREGSREQRDQGVTR